MRVCFDINEDLSFAASPSPLAKSKKLSRKEEKRMKRMKIGTVKSGVKAGDYGSEEGE